MKKIVFGAFIALSLLFVSCSKAKDTGLTYKIITEDEKQLVVETVTFCDKELFFKECLELGEIQSVANAFSRKAIVVINKR